MDRVCVPVNDVFARTHATKLRMRTCICAYMKVHKVLGLVNLHYKYHSLRIEQSMLESILILHKLQQCVWAFVTKPE